MTKYTPSTEEIRDRWMDFDGGPDPEDAAEFDRWLAAHDAEVRAEALSDQTDNYEWMVLSTLVAGPVAGRTVTSPITDEDTARLIADDPDSHWRRELVRRRAPGPWVTIHTNGSRDD